MPDLAFHLSVGPKGSNLQAGQVGLECHIHTAFRAENQSPPNRSPHLGQRTLGAHHKHRALHTAVAAIAAPTSHAPTRTHAWVRIMVTMIRNPKRGPNKNILRRHRRRETPLGN